MRQQKHKQRDFARHVPSTEELMQWRRLETFQRYERRRWQANAWKYGQYRVSDQRCECGRNHYALEFRSGTFSGFDCPMTWWGWLTLFSGGESVIELDAILRPIKGARLMEANTEVTALTIIERIRNADIVTLSDDDKAEIGLQIKQISTSVDPKTSPINAFYYGVYCANTGANIVRGEVSAWEDNDGRLVIHEGYKLYIKWAEYKYPDGIHIRTRKLDPIDYGEHPKSIIMECTILPSKDWSKMMDLIHAGMDAEEAFRFVGMSDIGVVHHDEIYRVKYWSNQHNKYIDIPEEKWAKNNANKSTTWEWKAEKRALSHAIRKLCGEPTQKFKAQQAYDVDGIQTELGDWVDVTGGREERCDLRKPRS